MKKVWCPLCGEEAWEVHGQSGPILIDPKQGPATDRIKITFHTAEGKNTVDYTIHRCTQIKYPKPPPTNAANAARRAVGLEPLVERGDSA